MACLLVAPCDSMVLRAASGSGRARSLRSSRKPAGGAKSCGDVLTAGRVGDFRRIRRRSFLAGGALHARLRASDRRSLCSPFDRRLGDASCRCQATRECGATNRLARRPVVGPAVWVLFPVTSRQTGRPSSLVSWRGLRSRGSVTGSLWRASDWISRRPVGGWLRVPSFAFGSSSPLDAERIHRYRGWHAALGRAATG